MAPNPRGSLAVPPANQASVSRRSNMSSRTKVVWISAFSAVLIAICAALATAPAQTKAAAPLPQDKLALAEGEVKQLLLLMDTNKNGKISKQEWMNFMEAEFERLDKDKSGELDVKELAQSKFRVSHFTSVGK